MRLTYTFSNPTSHHTYTVTGKFLKHGREKRVFIYKRTPPTCNVNTPHATTAQ